MTGILRTRMLEAVVACLLAACSGSVPSPTGEGLPEPSAEPTTTASSASAGTSTVAPSSPIAASPMPAPARWSELTVPDGPAPREDHTWTVASEGSGAFLFGGRDGATVYGDLWAYDFAADAWTRMETTGGPAPRFGHEAAWVDGIGVVVFAGQAGTTFFNDLWAFDPDAGTWSQLPSSGSVPVARYGTCMAVGPDGRLWISHGFTSDGTRFSDTRAWDPDTGVWTDETPEGDVPVNRCLHACWSTPDGRLVLFGGQTTGVTALDDRWQLAAGTWTRDEATQPAARNLYARARVGDGVLVLGGQAVDGSFLLDGWWLPDAGGAAVPLQVDGAFPPARSGAELVHDADGDRLLLFGGRNADGALADMWELEGVSGTPP